MDYMNKMQESEGMPKKDEKEIPLTEFYRMVRDNLNRETIEEYISASDYLGLHNLLKKNALPLQEKIIYRDICAANGVDDAQFELALSFLEKSKNSDMLYLYLKRLADKGYVKSFYYLATCYIHGYGCDINLQAARELILKAYIFKAYPDIVRDHYDFYSHVKELFEEHADVEQARNYFYGIDCGQNYQKAFTYFASAFLKDEDAYAGCMLGKFFQDGIGAKANCSVALEFYKRCRWGMTSYGYDDYFEMMPEYKIGMFLLDGIGTQQNKQLASYSLGRVADYYNKPENDIPERFASEINAAIEISDELFSEYGSEYEEEAEEWFDAQIEYVSN